MRHKKITTTRPREVERDGRIYTVNESTTERRPAVFDLDRAVRRTIVAGVALVVAVTMVWSTYAIGDLLSAAAPPLIAFGVAGVFDLAWILCMAMEWALRYDERARIPRAAGWLALAVSVSAIATHGALRATLLVGLVGAVISLLAKGLWTVLMMATTHRLNETSAQVVAQRKSEAAEELAMATVERELARTREATAAISAGVPAQPVSQRLTVESVRLSEPAIVEPARRSAVSREPVAFGFTPAGVRRAELVARAGLLLAGNPDITGAAAAEALDVPLASAKRYLNAAREAGR